MFSPNGAVLMGYIGVLLLSLMLGMACAVEVESSQERDLKIRYYGENCRNADGTVGSLADKVRGQMIFPATMQILSTNIGPAGRANLVWCIRSSSVNKWAIYAEALPLFEQESGCLSIRKAFE